MSTIKANTLLHSDGSTTNPPAIPALDKRMAKAWVNFNGTGVVVINGSYGVASLTDNGVGSYNVNFTTAMANANYSAVASCIGSSGITESIDSPTTSTFNVVLRDSGTNAVADNSVAAIVMGGS